MRDYQGARDSWCGDDAVRGECSAHCMLYSVYTVHSASSTQCMMYSVCGALSVCYTRCMLYSVYAVLGVCYTQLMLHPVCAVLGVCCTQCMLYSVYAVPGVWCTRCMLCWVCVVFGVNYWSWHEEWERDDLTWCSLVMVELRMRQREMRGDGTKYHEKLGLKRILCGSQFTNPKMGGLRTDEECNKTDMRSSQPNQASRTPAFHYPPISCTSVLSSSPMSLFLVQNSTIIAEHKVKSSLSISPCHDHELTPSTAYTKYSIHREQYTPRTVYTENSIHRVQHTLSNRG